MSGRKAIFPDILFLFLNGYGTALVCYRLFNALAADYALYFADMWM